MPNSEIGFIFSILLSLLTFILVIIAAVVRLEQDKEDQEIKDLINKKDNENVRKTPSR